ncbi:MAG TPA: hypothetical protein VE153_27720 [Myxococcus sp.]|nr:hypothetical protein [Myxococcus sp.]
MGDFNSQVRKLMLAVPLAAFAVGCGGEPLDETTEPAAGGEAVAQTEQAVGLGGSYWWGTSNNGYTSTTIGTATNRTCFLAGVFGNLQPAATGSWLSAGTFMNAGNWVIFVNHYASKALATSVHCINTAANRTPEVSWYQGGAAKLLGAATAQRRCFLTGVDGAGGFKSTSDHVRVWNDGTNWWLGGNLSGQGGASALCVDLPEDHGGWLWVAGNPGGFTENLAYNPGGVACLLSGVGGPFTRSDYSDGVSIDYNSGTRYWEMTVTNGKRGWGNCVR